MVELTAVLPAAGLGTRLRPLTDVLPKEILPIGRAPVIAHALSEVAACGIRQAFIVVSQGKQILEEYCGDGSAWGLECRYVLQPAMRGVGDAVLCAVRDGASPPMVIAFADCTIMRRCDVVDPAALTRLREAYQRYDADAAVLCESVAWDRVSHYGVLAPASMPLDRAEPFLLADIVEKPRREEAPSNLVVAARWILGPRMIAELEELRPDETGEVGVTEAVRKVVRSGARVVAVPLVTGERRLDVGNVRSYLEAQALASCHDPEFGEAVTASLRAAIA